MAPKNKEKKFEIINQALLSKIRSDENLRRYFLENFDSIIKKAKFCESNVMIELMSDQLFRTKILKNLNVIFPIMKSIPPSSSARARFIERTMNVTEIIQYSKSFFVGDSSQTKVNMAEIIDVLSKKGVPRQSKEVIVYNNLEPILKNANENLPEVLRKINPIIENSYDEQEFLDYYDMLMVKNIDHICKTNYGNDGFSFKLFDQMPTFKELIRSKGIKFFLDFPIEGGLTIPEYREISESLFGVFNSEAIANLMFAEGDATLAMTIRTMINELSNVNDGEEIKDFEFAGEGGFSESYKIGDWILKFGDDRYVHDIPNHRRIIQPVLRTRIKREDEQIRYLEIQNLVDTKKWHEELSKEEIDDILFTIYSEMRDSGIVWSDIKVANVGRLLKPNRTNFTFIDVDGIEKCITPVQNATGMEGTVPEEEILPEGEYVVIDTDYIEKYEDWIKKNSSRFLSFENDDYGDIISRTLEFEKRYQEEKEKSKKESQSKILDNEDSGPNI